jgi:erythromycin 3''-O-methyltransferase
LVAHPSDRHTTLYDELMFAPVMRSFYGGPWYNVGLWTAHDRADAASRALVERVASCVVQPPRRALDVGCGIGGSTMVLLQCWHPATLIGIGVSGRQLAQSRKICAEAHFLCADAAALPFADASFDAITAVEAALHFDSRPRFFAEARRVLTPGGTLALADLLPPSAAWPGSWSVPAANLGWSAARYADELSRVGFIGVRVDDVTAQTWGPYLDRFSAHVARQLQDSPFAWRASAQALRESEQPVYVIASAELPS